MDELLQSGQETKRFLEMEYNLTGCLLVDTAKTLKLIRGLLSAEDFQNDTCRAIYLAALDLYSSGKPLDYALIQDKAVSLGYSFDLEISREIRLSYSTTANAEEFARRMHAESQNRQAAALGLDMAYRRVTPLEANGKLQEILKRQNFIKRIIMIFSAKQKYLRIEAGLVCIRKRLCLPLKLVSKIIMLIILNLIFILQKMMS